MPERRTIRVQGVVQGVGFRPFVYGLADDLDLQGEVWNDRAGAVVDVEGDADRLDRFCDRLLEDAPPPVAIEHIESNPVPLKGYTGFSIAPSDQQTAGIGVVSPDLAICQECLRELHHPSDRRFGYPFLNCTMCGPRFTIVTETPYDRERTTMAGFGMCPACGAEYHNPHNRRFHAQPIACPACGPGLMALDAAGFLLETEDPLGRAVTALQAGNIVAIKGLGGYHLACDAQNASAVQALRRRKYRDTKALAVMVPDVETAGSYGHIGPIDYELLTSVQRPIVLLPKRDGADLPGIAPMSPSVGIMLPYTPLHHLLMERVGGPLVMTSGNRTEEPIAYRDREAVDRLSGIADLFLTHNRPIHARCDDSVIRVVLGEPLPIRRARGYVPLPLHLHRPAPVPILACGGHLKNVFCLAAGDQAFLSGHNGDLDNRAAFEAFAESIHRFQQLFRITPEVVVHDLHPDYRSTRYAQSLAHLPRIAVQHHHAHVAACRAENGVQGPTIGVAFDGTGYGTDGGLWGGEFLFVDDAGFERAAHLEALALPGGEQAIRHPWRIAAGLLFDHYGDGMEELDLEFVRRLNRRDWSVLRRMLATGLNTPRTSSAGRLFDAVAALIGLCPRTSYEAQAAIELETLAGHERSKDLYASEIREPGSGLPAVVSTVGLIRGVVDDLQRGQPPAAIASRFHSTVADLILATCRWLRSRSGIRQVALSGGVFQNARLLAETVEALSGDGFAVYRHSQVPPNDGGLALGQVAVATALLRRKE